ncbi:MAG: DUF3368 domain-containing protein [Bacteroidales bacterium]|nr:DUF3368 domain-containing protein [Bacteroidales bacterium]
MPFTLKLKLVKTKLFTKIYHKSNGLIENLKPLLEELIEKDVWISEKLKREILSKVGE